MRGHDVWIGGGLLTAIVVGLSMYGDPTPDKSPPDKSPPKQPPPKQPTPPKRPAPKPKPRRPWGAQIGGAVAPDGLPIQCDLPGRLHQKNRGGSDGAGLCVFASMRHSGLYQDEPLFAGVFEYMWKHPGGGYPRKVDEVLRAWSAESGLPIPHYVQIEDGDLEVLKLACRNGLMPAVTYSRSPTGRYQGQSVSHMVSLPHATDSWFAVLDNNYIGDDAYEWMTPAEFSKTYGRKGWAVILLHKSPPPPPRNTL